MACHFYSFHQRLRRLRQTRILVQYGALFGGLTLIIGAVGFSDVIRVLFQSLTIPRLSTVRGPLPTPLRS